MDMIFVRQRLEGTFDVWMAAAEQPEPVPAVGSDDHLGLFLECSNALSAAHDHAALLSLCVKVLPKEEAPPLSIDGLRTRINRAHPRLQIALCEWLAKEMPGTHARLKDRILMPSGYYTNESEVALYMATAALNALEQACMAVGLDAS